MNFIQIWINSHKVIKKIVFKWHLLYLNKISLIHQTMLLHGNNINKLNSKMGATHLLVYLPIPPFQIHFGSSYNPSMEHSSTLPSLGRPALLLCHSLVLFCLEAWRWPAMPNLGKDYNYLSIPLSFSLSSKHASLWTPAAILPHLSGPMASPELPLSLICPRPPWTWLFF
jgi:hypothetical protein